jgi:hypothetical protein
MRFEAEVVMSQGVAVVFTGESIDEIVARGGTCAWRLDPRRARLCEFVVCTRNARADRAERREAHQAAFLIGKIRDVVPYPYTDSTTIRYLIRFSEFARLNVPNVWSGYQNPVKYMSVKEVGIEPSTLRWEPMPESVGTVGKTDEPTVAPTNGAKPLTLNEAKNGLAQTFGVSPEAVEITIRG